MCVWAWGEERESTPVSYNCVFCIVFCCRGCKLILCQFLEKPSDVSSPTGTQTQIQYTGESGFVEWNLSVQFKAHIVFCTSS